MRHAHAHANTHVNMCCVANRFAEGYSSPVWGSRIRQQAAVLASDAALKLHTTQLMLAWGGSDGMEQLGRQELSRMLQAELKRVPHALAGNTERWDAYVADTLERGDIEHTGVWGERDLRNFCRHCLLSDELREQYEQRVLARMQADVTLPSAELLKSKPPRAEQAVQAAEQLVLQQAAAKALGFDPDAVACLAEFGHDHFFGNAGLLASVESGALAPLRGSYIAKLHRDGGRLKRRQDMPPEAFWTATELRAVVEALGSAFGVLFVVLSYRWLSKV